MNTKFVVLVICIIYEVFPKAKYYFNFREEVKLLKQGGLTHGIQHTMSIFPLKTYGPPPPYHIRKFGGNKELINCLAIIKQ